MKRTCRRVVLAGILAVSAGLVAAGHTAAKPAIPDPARFGAMTCQQLWYVEQQVLADGRVCLTTERARRAFRRSERCISSSEAILPGSSRDYLARLRKQARQKGCSGF